MNKRVVCTEQVPYGACPESASIVATGVSSNGENYATERLTVPEILSEMDRGVFFYTYGETSKSVVAVLSFWCSRCGKRHIRTAPDAVWDNNLDSLRYCSWKVAA